MARPSLRARHGPTAVFRATPRAASAGGGVTTGAWKIPPSQPTHTVEVAAGPENSIACTSGWAPEPTQLGSATGFALLAGRNPNVQVPASAPGLTCPRNRAAFHSPAGLIMPAPPIQITSAASGSTAMTVSH